MFIYVAVKINQPATTTSHLRDFEIKKGERAGQIAARLAEEGLVGSELGLKIYLRARRAESKLQAGSYALDSSMTISEIVEILTKGLAKAQGKRVTIIEGWDISDMAKHLEEQGLAGAQEFISTAKNGDEFAPEFEFLSEKPPGNSLEGFLFPDTYFIREGAGPENIIRRMLANFGTKIQPEVRYDDLILASIVEREVGRNVKKGTALSEQDRGRLQEERRIVAGIFLKRLKLGMSLDSDATISYITGSSRNRATFEELKIDSPYNTYKYRGLPPTPISSPSLDSIMAVLEPRETDYLFFLTDDSGEAHFAKTLAEHLANKQKYIE